MKKLWTKDFIANFIINFLVLITYYSIMVIMANHAMENMGASPSQAGLASGILIIAALVARIFSGRFIELVGKKKLLLIGLIVYLAAILMYFVSQSYPLLIISRILHGIGFGIATTATATIAAHIIPESRNGEGIGYFALSATLASAIGPFIGMSLYHQTSFFSILILCITLVIINFLISISLKPPEIILTESQRNELKGFRPKSFFEASAIPISLVGLMVFFCYSSIIGFLSSYTGEISLEKAGSFFFIVYSVAIILSRPLTGLLFDISGANFVMYPAFILFSIGLVILSMVQTSLILFLAAVLMGIGFGSFLPSGQAIAIKFVERHKMGLATTTYFGISELGFGFGPSILGLLISRIGYRSVYMILSVVVIIAMIIYYVLCKTKYIVT